MLGSMFWCQGEEKEEKGQRGVRRGQEEVDAGVHVLVSGIERRREGREGTESNIEG